MQWRNRIFTHAIDRPRNCDFLSLACWCFCVRNIVEFRIYLYAAPVRATILLIMRVRGVQLSEWLWLAAAATIVYAFLRVRAAECVRVRVRLLWRWLRLGSARPPLARRPLCRPLCPPTGRPPACAPLVLPAPVLSCAVAAAGRLCAAK